MIRLLAVVMLASCGGSSPPPARPIDPQPHGQTTPVVTAALTEQECDRLFTHTVEVMTPQPLDAAEQAKVTADLRTQMMAECRQEPRSVFDCAMAARDADAMAACQRMPSSSTSNNSVAPPGITPPAPRAP